MVMHYEPWQLQPSTAQWNHSDVIGSQQAATNTSPGTRSQYGMSRCYALIATQKHKTISLLLKITMMWKTVILTLKSLHMSTQKS